MISLVIYSSISVLDCCSLLTSVHKTAVVTYQKYYNHELTFYLCFPIMEFPSGSVFLLLLSVVEQRVLIGVLFGVFFGSKKSCSPIVTGNVLLHVQ